jgi:hypothetical protein
MNYLIGDFKGKSDAWPLLRVSRNQRLGLWCITNRTYITFGPAGCLEFGVTEKYA